MRVGVEPLITLEHEGANLVIDGDAGAPLTDYDVIGSPEAGSGLFALASAEDVRFVCIPPLERDRHAAPGGLLVASRLCRERHAPLLVDPPPPRRACTTLPARTAPLPARAAT